MRCACSRVICNICICIYMLYIMCGCGVSLAFAFASSMYAPTLYNADRLYIYIYDIYRCI